MMLLIRSITDLPSITLCPAKQKAAPSIVVANAFRHLQLVRADRKPGSSQERTLNDTTWQGSRIPPAHRAWSAALRHQFGVSGSWIAKTRFRWTGADRMMLLGSAGFGAAPIVPCLLLIVRFSKSIEPFFSFRCTSLKASCSVPCYEPASHFVIPHFPRLISSCSISIALELPLTPESIKSSLARQLRVITRGNFK